MNTIKDLLNDKGHPEPKRMKKARELFGEDLFQKYPHATFKEAAYLEIYNMEHPVCQNEGCNNHTRLYTFTSGFSTYCSVKCKNQSIYGRQGARKSKGPEATKKREATCMAKYGVRHISQTEHMQQKAKETMLERFGVDHFMKDPNRSKDVSGKRIDNWFPQRIDALSDITLLSEDYVDCYTDLQWRCNNCHTTFWQNLRDGRTPVCPVCYKGRSIPEEELINFIRDLGLDTIKNDRKVIAPQEIDVLIPGFKLGIEFDGLWYHSNQRIPSTYHMQKTEDAEAQGYRLIHIFEDEWKKNRPLVESKLRHLLGKSERRYYARTLTLREVLLSERRPFFTRTHLQGDTGAKICYGLYDNDNNLLMAASFKKSRFRQKEHFELIRLSTELNTSVVGGASKLIKYARSVLGPLVSYADRRWSTGGVYSEWDYLGKTDPGYFWCKGLNRISRYKTTRKNLMSMDTYSEDKSQREIMEEAGYWRIFDCGHLIFFYP